MGFRSRLASLLTSGALAALERRPSLEYLVSAGLGRRRLAILLTDLKSKGVEINVVYDVGAHRGEWTRLVRSTLPDAGFYLFEANSAHAAALRDVGEPFYIAVLSSEEKHVDFYGTGGPGDSYYREATEHYAGVRPQQLEATTLDRMVALHGLPYPDFVKIDVQGAEIDVLRGATNALAAARLVLLECPLAEYNEGAPDIVEYVRFMHDSGFGPAAFLDSLWQGKRMVQIDVLFARMSVLDA